MDREVGKGRKGGEGKGWEGKEGGGNGREGVWKRGNVK